jgi:hypothetical protein
VCVGVCVGVSACVRCEYAHEQMLQLYPVERCKKKLHRNLLFVFCPESWRRCNMLQNIGLTFSFA